MNAVLLPVEEMKEPPPQKYTTEEENRLKRQVHRISISHSVSVTYAIVLSCAALAAIGLVLFLSDTISMQIRIWLGTIMVVLIVSLQIMLLIYSRDPVFAIHFVAVLMLVTGVVFALSTLHLFCK